MSQSTISGLVIECQSSANHHVDQVSIEFQLITDQHVDQDVNQVLIMGRSWVSIVTLRGFPCVDEPSFPALIIGLQFLLRAHLHVYVLHRTAMHTLNLIQSCCSTVSCVNNSHCLQVNSLTG